MRPPAVVRCPTAWIFCMRCVDLVERCACARTHAFQIAAVCGQCTATGGIPHPDAGESTLLDPKEFYGATLDPRP